MTWDEETAGAPSRVLEGAFSKDDFDETRLRSAPLALAAMPGGTLVGTLIHGVMERVAFDAIDLAGEVDGAVRHEQAYFNVDLGARENVVGVSARPSSRLWTRHQGCGCATWPGGTASMNLASSSPW